jgi:hypothetical protein
LSGAGDPHCGGIRVIDDGFASLKLTDDFKAFAKAPVVIWSA